MFLKRKEKLNIDSLKNTFDAQKKILIEKGYSEMLGVDLESFNSSLEILWKSVLEKTENLQIEIKGNIPLLLVANNNLQERINKIKGHTELDFKNIKTSETEKNFYVILDVEDGAKMVAKSAKDALNKFKKENRFALNLDESIALLTYYPEILKNHYLITAGSFYNKERENLPLLWLLDEDHNPELHYAWFDIAHGSYGTASYSIKI
jgi:hypothetical protein